MDGVRPFNFFSCGHANEFFCDEEAEAMITEVNATFDVDERNTLLTELLEHTKENPPAIWLSETIELWAHVSELSGFSVDNFNIKFEDVSLG
jgi:ABC-type transport system substrate-binding protein